MKLTNYDRTKQRFRKVYNRAAHSYSKYFRLGSNKIKQSIKRDALEYERQIAAPYFDASFYLAQNPDIVEEGIDPLTHFLIHGCGEDRDPSATFSVRWYRQHYMLEEPVSKNPFIHFLKRCETDRYSSPLQLDEELMGKISGAFDVSYYRKMYFFDRKLRIDALEHYLTVGWLLGYNPNESFSTAYYSKMYSQHIEIGMNPFVHYWTKGKKIGLSGHHHLLPGHDTPKIRSLFDRDFYLSAYPEIRRLGIDPFEHYMINGWKEGKDPSSSFSTVFYARGYRDVAESGLHPLVHYALRGDGRKTQLTRPHLPIASGIEQYAETEIAARQQDMCFPLPLGTSKRIAVIVVPEHNEMSGGIFSMFSIANRLRKTKNQHGYDIVLMTNPNTTNQTYCRQTNFRNQEDIFRFEQIVFCIEAEEIYLHIPEYACKGFLSRCSEQVRRYLLSRNNLYINILNQNIELMPAKRDFIDLRRIADQITQSVAHHAYFSQEQADRYQLPTLLLPAYTDLSEYIPVRASEKDDIIIYSYDDAWYKNKALEKVRAAFPLYQLIEIRGITFDHYMDLATRCRFSISFGEGFDGYVAQPIYQGGIGFTVYREEFFPADNFLEFPNFFKDPEKLIENIAPLMIALSKDFERHDALNHRLVSEWDKLYSLSDYQDKIKKLGNREFELFPTDRSA